MVSPFNNSLQIDVYKNQLFGPPSKVSIILNDTPSISINCAAFQPHNDMPNYKYLFKYSCCDIPVIEKVTILLLTINHITIVKSKDKVFFIWHTTDGIMKARFYLVQVDIESTLKNNPLCTNNGEDYCMFFTNHPKRKYKIDKFGRWWQDLYH